MPAIHFMIAGMARSYRVSPIYSAIKMTIAGSTRKGYAVVVRG
jgi:hypothetical protein